MMQIWRLALNDLRLTARDRPALVWLLIFPLLMMWFFSGSGGGKSSGATGLSILDLDGGQVAEQFVAFIEQSELKLTRIDDASLADQQLRLLTIPEGFSRAFSNGQPQELTLELAADARPDHSLGVRIELTRSIAQLLGTHARVELGRPRTPIELAVSHAGAGRPVPTGAAQSVPGACVRDG